MKRCYRAGWGALAFGVSLCLSACSPSTGERSLVEMKQVREVKGALGGVCSLNFKAGEILVGFKSKTKTGVSYGGLCDFNCFIGI